jgi:hypothetical protein
VDRGRDLGRDPPDRNRAVDGRPSAGQLGAALGDAGHLGGVRFGAAGGVRVGPGGGDPGGDSKDRDEAPQRADERQPRSRRATWPFDLKRPAAGGIGCLTAIMTSCQYS